MYVRKVGTQKSATGPEDVNRDVSQEVIREVIRGVEAFRRGLPVVIRTDEGHQIRPPILALAVETLTDRRLKALSGGEPALLILTQARARTLKIRLYTADVAAIRPDLPLSPARLKAIADPTNDLADPLKGPFATERGPLSPGYAAAVKLAKLAGLLPAVLAQQREDIPARSVRVGAKAIFAFEAESARALEIVTRAHVPLEGAEAAELVAFRAGDGGPEHFAVVIGSPPSDDPVLTRLHSECFTGDLLGSLKCDCGSQLRGAIETIAKAGGGVLLYLAQEGRGIGLVNKLRAYHLQDQGFDTIEANERLGFEPDERLYVTAARMLSLLGYRAVRLLTNNPDKVAALAGEGISVVERVPHAFPANPHNRAYLKTKADKAGHLF